MSVEIPIPINKEEALIQFEKALRGYSKDDPKYDSGDFINNAYKLVQEAGASEYEVRRIEFLVELPEDRQQLLNIEARGDFKNRVHSLEHGAELLRTYEKIRSEFGLKDPYIR